MSGVVASKRWLPAAIIVTIATTMELGCAFVARKTEPTPAATRPGSAVHPNAVQAESIEGYAAAIKAASQRTDHESDSKVRADLAAEASGNADACLALDPRAAACQYGKAVATGLEARSHPTRAVGLLGSMLLNLSNAETADPDYDKAGPARVRALVLIRAPGWPIGPGDADAGLAAARRALSRQPDYPPNLLALAEALSKTGDENGARDNYAHARERAESFPAGPDRDDWMREAADGLNHK